MCMGVGVCGFFYVYCSMPHYRVILHALYYLILDLHESFTIISQVVELLYVIVHLVM